MPAFWNTLWNAIGMTDGSVAATGAVGEKIESVVSVAVGSAFTIGQWGNVTSIAVTAGDWDVHGVLANTLIATVSKASMAISLFSANTTTDHVLGSNVLDLPLGIATFTGGAGISSFGVNVSVPTTIFLKGFLATAVGNAFTGRLSARRMR
jgi:hypothetical protein